MEQAAVLGLDVVDLAVVLDEGAPSANGVELALNPVLVDGPVGALVSLLALDVVVHVPRGLDRWWLPWLDPGSDWPGCKETWSS